ncbi:MAG: 2,3-diphosphoglycerate-dependent phosphoglycerate mutase [Lentimicrobiaceae bacterium]|nr:2,3-diphosphoglycerate-dependent phosphoglycerate mutase [Lentimicrobiaceae bacterium]
MYQLILLRHGESEWNKANRFTGWTDVDLSEKGMEEAKEAGRILKKEGYEPRVAYTSYLKRAIKTLHLTLEEMDLLWIPEFKTWRLNEKHYGMLQGLNKAETAAKYGDEQVLLWRRSYDIPPPALDDDHPLSSRNDRKYQEMPRLEIPATEALKHTIDRIVPYWLEELEPSLRHHGQILIAAHGNSLRGIVKYLKNMSEEAIIAFNIPTGIPYVFEFDGDMKLVRDFFLGDPEEIKKLMDQVANQAKGK